MPRWGIKTHENDSLFSREITERNRGETIGCICCIDPSVTAHAHSSPWQRHEAAFNIKTAADSTAWRVQRPREKCNDAKIRVDSTDSIVDGYFVGSILCAAIPI